ncbi:MAG: DNA-binding CsgD family transcriptional regulator [Marinoscillum sp.]|jgi:DNA-binding CsgD family transcriptional regulator
MTRTGRAFVKSCISKIRQIGLESFTHLTLNTEVMSQHSITRKSFKDKTIVQIYKIPVMHVVKNDNSMLDGFMTVIPQQRYTQREIDILMQMSAGSTADQIADILFISPNTVRTHIKNMLRKSGSSNSIEMIARAIRSSVID